MVRRLFLAMAAAAAFSASAAVCVVALAFALYALVAPSVGQAGAAAIVAAAAALLIAAAALVMAASARGKRAAAQPVGGVRDRLIRFVREKPVMAVSAALGAGFLAVRNPLYLGAALRAFFEGREPPRR